MFPVTPVNSFSWRSVAASAHIGPPQMPPCMLNTLIVENGISVRIYAHAYPCSGYEAHGRPTSEGHTKIAIVVESEYAKVQSTSNSHRGNGSETNGNRPVTGRVHVVDRIVPHVAVQILRPRLPRVAFVRILPSRRSRAQRRCSSNQKIHRL
jgi:hypothetical protein